jgi:hypothetical protein
VATTNIPVAFFWNSFSRQMLCTPV